MSHSYFSTGIRIHVVGENGRSSCIFSGRGAAPEPKNGRTQFLQVPGIGPREILTIERELSRTNIYVNGEPLSDAEGSPIYVMNLSLTSCSERYF